MSPKISHRRSSWRTCGTTKRAARRFLHRLAPGGFLTPADFSEVRRMYREFLVSTLAADIARAPAPQIKLVSAEYPYRVIPVPPEHQERLAAILAPPEDSGLIERMIDEATERRRPK